MSTLTVSDACHFCSMVWPSGDKLECLAPSSFPSHLFRSLEPEARSHHLFFFLLNSLLCNLRVLFLPHELENHFYLLCLLWYFPVSFFAISEFIFAFLVLPLVLSFLWFCAFFLGCLSLWWFLLIWWSFTGRKSLTLINRVCLGLLFFLRLVYFLFFLALFVFIFFLIDIWFFCWWMSFLFSYRALSCHVTLPFN